MLLFSQIDAVVEQVEDAVAIVEMLLSSHGREPGPVQDKQGEEDEDGEAKVQLQQSRAVDIRDHGDDDADAGDEPQKPPFMENRFVGIFDLQSRDQKESGALLDTWSTVRYRA